MKIKILQVKIKQAGMTVRDACEQAEITTPTFYEMIKRNNTTAGHLEKLARVLGFPVQDFFDDDVKVNPIITSYSSAAEPSATYYTAKAKPELIHVGKIIEARMKRLKISIKEVAEATGTSSQNISQMLGRKSIAFDKAVELNNILNPPGSKEWDIFSYYSRSSSKSIEHKYIELLEDFNKMQAEYLHLLEKTNKSTD